MSKRWSITVASEKVGVSVNTFNRWERGLQVPQLGTLDMVCKAFNMSPEDLGFGNVIAAKRRTRQRRDEEEAEPAVSPLVPLTSATAEMHNVIMSISGSLCELSLEQAGRNLKHMGQVAKEEDGSDEDMVDKELTRRRAISALIGTPITILGLGQREHTKLLHPEEIVSLCEMSIPLLWRLYFEGGLNEVNQNLPGYLIQLTKLAQEPSPSQKRAASLASQGYQLASLLASQYQNFGTAVTYASRALTFANLVEDPHLQAAALIRQALVYFYLKRPQQRLYAYERALQYSQKASPLLQGRANIGLSETHSFLGHELEASHHLGLARKTFPRRCEEDPAFPYTHFSDNSLLGLEGMMLLNLSHPQQAWENFLQIDRELPHTPVPDRLELTIHQAMASYKLGERDQSCNYLELALRSASMTGNQLRYGEAYCIYDQLLQKWGKETRVKELGLLFLNTRL
jgi:transcriptional regulator with XRE-family HTH domain/tetratricopeptide (TPR) repeat protein